MKVSLNWLNEYLSHKISAAEAEEILTNTGLEVEETEIFENIKGGLQGVVTGLVKEREKHPDADRLSVTKVDTGQGELLQIVCGAPNVAAGQKVLVATVGTVLYPGGEKLEIKKSKIRGAESQGMICAEDELGLGNSHEGIMVLPEDTPVGMPAAQYFNLENDIVLEINITPNRSDATSHIGVARDIVAFQRLKNPEANLLFPDVKLPAQSETFPLELVVENEEACPRYSGMIVSHLKVGPSPQWLKNKLQAVGLRPVNNVVDITNYVQFEMGHPLHAFDLDKVTGKKIVVKNATEGNAFITLDSVERKLHADDLMICNAEAPMCIAGVFGGLDSGVTEHTHTVFIESAYFNPVSIRKTSKSHGLHTDASFRFERGTDPDITIRAAERAAQLMTDICEGKIASAVLDLYTKKIEPKKIHFTYHKLDLLTGISIPKTTVKNILVALGITIEKETEEALDLSIPAYKTDVTRDVDIVEEVIRIYGINEIEINPNLKAVFGPTGTSSMPLKKKVAELLVNNGFYETLTNSLLNSKYQEKLKGELAADAVPVLNPISSELNIMRNEFIYSGLEVVAHNINHKADSIKIFETGKIYTTVTNQGATYRDTYHEQEILGVWISGDAAAEMWYQKAEPTGFYEIKGVAESLLSLLKIPHKPVASSENSLFKHAFSVSGFKNPNAPLVVFGEVHPSVLKIMGIKQPVFYAEFQWELLLQQIPQAYPVYTALPKFPSVRRDLALVLDKKVEYRSLKELSFKTEKNLLQEVNIFDIYEGKGIPEDKKSYALSFIFRDKTRTLTDADIDQSMQKLMDQFKKEFNAEIRS